MIRKWSEIPKYQQISVRLIIGAVFLRMVLHVLTYTFFTPKFSYSGNDLTVVSGIIFYLFLFTFLIVRILQQNKWAKIFALLLTIISLFGLSIIDFGDLGLNDFLWIMHFILLATATVVLFRGQLMEINKVA